MYLPATDNLKNCPPFENNSGFSLLELLVTTTILAVLTAVTLPYFHTFTANQELVQAAEQVITDLRTVQNRALSAIDRSVSGTSYYWWGIDFVVGGDATVYTLAQSSNEITPLGGSVVRRTKTLPNGFEFTTDESVWFKMVNGETDHSGPLTITICSTGGSSCRNITISDVGLIE